VGHLGTATSAGAGETGGGAGSDSSSSSSSSEEIRLMTGGETCLTFVELARALLLLALLLGLVLLRFLDEEATLPSSISSIEFHAAAEDILAVLYRTKRDFGFLYRYG